MKQLRCDQSAGAGIGACDECSQYDPWGAEDDEQHHAEDADRCQTEDAQIALQIPRNQFRYVGNARDHHLEVRPVESLLHYLYFLDGSFTGALSENDKNVTGLLVLGDQQPRPEPALEGILHILRPPAQRFNAGYSGDVRQLVRESANAIEVGGRVDVTSGRDDKLWWFRKEPEDPIVRPHLRVLLGEEEIFVHLRFQIDHTKQCQ